MEKTRIAVVLGVVVLTAAIAQAQRRSAAAEGEAPRQAQEEAVRPAPADVEATLTDIRQTFGTVPQFMQVYPQEALPGAWEAMKGLQLAETEVPGRYKELIGLAVAAQVPCEYCSYFHTEAAKLHGATEPEAREAIALAAVTYQMSTYAMGSGIGGAELRRDTTRLEARMRQMRQAAEGATGQEGEAAQPEAPQITDAQSARQDIERTLGFVPAVWRAVPDEAVAGLWRNTRDLYMTDTEIPAKYKTLIGVAVSAQMACSVCTDHHASLARAMGATDAEIAEAVAVAGSVRHWSTVLNGNLIDPAAFRRETDQIMTHLRRAAEAAQAPRR
jgi:AhpD family alkylhydroperoxidase